jgi:hypothetical protein
MWVPPAAPPWVTGSARRPSGADLGHPIFPLDTRVRRARYFTRSGGRGATAVGGLVWGGRAGARRACGLTDDVLVAPPKAYNYQ